MRLEEEIKQEKFKSEFIKAEVNIIFTASWLESQKVKLLKPFDISPQQFNLLRILRGQFPNSSSLKLVSSRMIDKMSNTSRLVEKLRVKGLVERAICENNRRQIDIKITQKGLDLIKQASVIIENVTEKTLSINAIEAAQLNLLLDKIRG